MRRILKKILKWVGIVVLIPIVFLLLLLIALYIPAVQDFAIEKALEAVNSGGEMKIEVGDFRLGFPLDLKARSVKIFQKGDTMLMVSRADVDVAVLPLLWGEVKANDLEIRDVFFKSGSPDSITYIRATVGHADIDEGGVHLFRKHIDLGKVTLGAGDVKISLRRDSTPPTPPSEVPWVISVRRLDVDDVSYGMTTETSLQDLSAHLAALTAKNGTVNLKNNKFAIRSVEVKGLTGKLLASESKAESLPEQPDTFPRKPMKLDIGTISLTDGDVVYAKAGAEPKPGLDFDYIQASRVEIEVDSLHMDGSEMRVPIGKLALRERSGLSLEASGVFSMDSTEIRADGFRLDLLASHLTLDAIYGTDSSVPSQQVVSVDLGAEIAPADLQIAFPSMAKLIEGLPRNRTLNLGARIDGTMADLHIDRVSAAMNGYWNILAQGNVRDLTDLDHAEGNVDLSGEFSDMNFLKPTLMDAKLQKTLNLPPLKIKGGVSLREGIIDGTAKLLTHEGNVALDAKWNNRNQAYAIDLDADKFPVRSFMPGLGLGDVTAKIEAKGHGFDFFNPSTELTARVDAIDILYNKQRIHDLTLAADLHEGNADVSVDSRNAAINLSLKASGNLSGKTYDWTLGSDIRNLNLYALGLADTIADFAGKIDGKLSMTPAEKRIAAEVNLKDYNAMFGKAQIGGSPIVIGLEATDSSTYAHIVNGSMQMKLSSPMPLDTVIARASATGNLLADEIAKRRIDVIRLHNTLPQMDLSLDAATGNVMHSFLQQSGLAFNQVNMRLSNDSIISFNAAVDTLATGSMRIDRATLMAVQNGQFLRYRLRIDNQPGTLDAFAHVQANGYVADDNVSLFMRQQNVKGETGFNFGVVSALTDSTISLKFIPYTPVIGYRQWTVNKDNFILFNTRDLHLDANLKMNNQDSRLQIYTDHDSLTDDHSAERMYVKLDNIKIQEWLSLSPFSPPMTGSVSADINMGVKGNSFNGKGSVSVVDFAYNKQRVGTLDLDVDLTQNKGGFTHALASLLVDGRKVITADGTLNDSTSATPFNLDFIVDRLPLSIANPFVGKTAKLAGYLDGSMDVTGTLKAPIFNGYLNFDSASVKVGMLGSSFRFTDEKIPVDSNVVRFKGYEIFGSNENPLTINGSVSMKSLSHIALDLALNADNMQVVNNDKRHGSDVYGKAFVSLDASAKGSLRFIDVNAAVTVEPGTNVTYVIPEATTQLTSRSTGDMVRFVNFADTTAVETTDSVAPAGTMINLNAMLTVSSGSTIGIDLSADGKNRVQLQSNGTLNYDMNPLGDSRFTGRLNISGGFVRYTPPLMSEKLFDFQEGSYVAFSGDMMNPRLNILAVDKILANVTQEGQNSRLIDFDVSLKVTGTLNQMDVVFDLSTKDDVTVENELQAMTPEQRANQAMNLLLYNTYTGPGTKGTASLSGNPLYSFLESTVNSWMANNIKGVDISFGIDQYKRTYEGASSTATSYSYKVSKSFMDDRIKIVVGGNYSTDADTDENLSQNLINDISFEYYLNNTGTMYLRLFRHTGFESILEGEVTQTGVGFVYKRKINNLRELFMPFRKKSKSLKTNDDYSVHSVKKEVVARKNESENGTND